MASFTSPVYRQEEIAGCGDPDDFPAIPSFMPWTPSVTPPRVTPQVMPKSTPQLSTNQLMPHTLVLWGCLRERTPSGCIMSTTTSIIDLHFIMTMRV